MKKLLIFLCLIATLQLGSGQYMPRVSSGNGAVYNPTAVGIVKEIWIAKRTDSVTGDGSIGNPIDAGTDLGAVLTANVTSNMTVHLGPGTAAESTRWIPTGLSNVKIIGAGREITIVQNTSTTIGAVTQQDVWYFDGSNTKIEISDLTIDANRAILPAANSVSCLAIEGTNDCYIRRVRATGAKSDSGNARETFTLRISNTTRGGIEDCQVDNCDGYVCGIVSWNTTDVNISRNKITGFVGSGFNTGINIAGPITNMHVESNMTDGVRDGFHYDTGALTNVTVANNQFYNFGQSGVFWTGGGAQTNCRIHNNLTSSANYNGWAHIVVADATPGRNVGMEISNNTIIFVGTPASAQLGLQFTDATNGVAKDNRLTVGLRTLGPSNNTNCTYNNNTTLDGKQILKADNVTPWPRNNISGRLSRMRVWGTASANNGGDLGAGGSYVTMFPLVGQTVDFDTDSVFNATNGRVTPGKIGMFRVNVKAQWTLGNQLFVVHLYKNGSDLSGTTPPYEMIGTNQYTAITASFIINVTSATDYYEFFYGDFGWGAGGHLAFCMIELEELPQ